LPVVLDIERAPMPVFSRLSLQTPRKAARQNRQRYQHEDFGGSVLKPSKHAWVWHNAFAFCVLRVGSGPGGFQRMQPAR